MGGGLKVGRPKAEKSASNTFEQPMEAEGQGIEARLRASARSAVPDFANSILRALTRPAPTPHSQFQTIEYAVGPGGDAGKRGKPV